MIELLSDPQAWIAFATLTAPELVLEDLIGFQQRFGLVDSLPVMIAAVVVSVGLIMLFAPAIGGFVTNHSTIKMLALAFLVVVGVVLIAEGFDNHVPKGYAYFAMAFSVGVELLNIRMRKRSTKPVKLREAYRGDESAAANDEKR